MNKNLPSIIGLKVRYYDYVGGERYGKIVAADPYPLDPNQVYVYIEDEDPNENRYDYTTMNGVIYYAEMRLSSEVYIID